MLSANQQRCWKVETVSAVLDDKNVELHMRIMVSDI